MTNTLFRKPLLFVAFTVLVAALATPAFAQFIRRDRVLAYDTDVWTVWAPSGYTRVVVDGDGDTDLDCWVYDRFDSELGSDTDATALCIISFYNPSSRYLTIRIQNLGDVYNEYELTVD